MELSVLIATAGFMLALVGATVAGVWTVGTVRATAEKTSELLATEIRSLRDGIAEFKAEVRAARQDHELRLRKLESEMRDCPALIAHYREEGP